MSASDVGTWHTGRGHAVLIVEDDPLEAETLCASVRSRGDTPYHVVNVDDALKGLETRQFCYCIVDQQLPTSATELTPMLGGGECVLETIRAKDGRRNARGCHTTPIIVVTGYSGHEDFVSKMYDLGADAFLSKPTREKVEVLLDRIREITRRAGRGEHGACAELNRGAGPWRVPEAVVPQVPVVATAAVRVDVTIVIDGRKVGARTIVVINGEERSLQDAKFVVLLRLVVAREKSAAGWGSREELGLDGTNRDATARIREIFEGIVPEGVNPVEKDGRGQFRLNLGIGVGGVEWDALKGHPSAAVRRVAEKKSK